jgi:hypothetical protein
MMLTGDVRVGRSDWKYLGDSGHAGDLGSQGLRLGIDEPDLGFVSDNAHEEPATLLLHETHDCRLLLQ